MIYVDSIDKIPDGEHYVALTNVSTSIPGDERSRTNPGHGYPAHTENSMKMVVFTDAEEMKEWVRKEKGRYHHHGFRIFLINEVNITTKIVVDMG